MEESLRGAMTRMGKALDPSRKAKAQQMAQQGKQMSADAEKNIQGMNPLQYGAGAYDKDTVANQRQIANRGNRMAGVAGGKFAEGDMEESLSGAMTRMGKAMDPARRAKAQTMAQQGKQMSADAEKNIQGMNPLQYGAGAYDKTEVAKQRQIANRGARMAGVAGGKFAEGDPMGLEEKLSAPQLKKFAKLAPPRNKVTFADKIAGAKKEVDEMLGDVAADAMRNALGGKKQMTDEGSGQFYVYHKTKGDRAGGADYDLLKTFPDKDSATSFAQKYNNKISADKKNFHSAVVRTKSVKKDMDEGWDDMMKDVKHRAHSTSDMKTGERKRSSTGGEIEKTATGLRHHAKSHDHDDDDKKSDDAPRGRGRPKGPEKKAERVTGKAWKHKHGRVKEGEDDIVDRGEYDREGDMVKDNIHTIRREVDELEKIIGDNENLPEWVEEKLSQAKGMIMAASEYMQTQHERDAEDETGEEGITMGERAVSKKQRKFMGMAHAIQKGEKVKGASPELKKVAKTMKPKDTEDFAKTKEKGLPEKKAKKEEVEETTTSGSVATAAPNGKAKSGSMSFGKGVYEGINSQVERMITEGMNVSVNMTQGDDGQPHKSITVSAEGEEAENLAQLLRLAGMHKQPEEACPTCGSAPCGCDENVAENAPDWPTNTESSPNATQYSGGLNGPKSTGQTTTPVIAGQRQRMSTMEENVQIERSLFKLFNTYKAS
jgi:hypothetical protein